MMKMCKCKNLPKFFKSDSSDSYFKKFKRIDWKDDAWVKLIKCPVCGQHWQLDEWDKYQTGLAIKIKEPESWRSYNDKDVRIDFLIQNRGGLSDGICAWQGCNNQALKGLAYCPTCAYEKSGLRE
ncbi:MAG: hypothetical protein GQ578_04430 [Desulfuromonadaceae bacterium]|nr:hypothetical protein [Desulfuromonadaceae bacterium]